MLAVELRAAQESDVPFLLQLRALSLEPHEKKAGLPPSAQRRLERVRAHFEAGQVIELAGQPVGLVKVVRSAQRWKLLQLQVLPQYQGRGIGTEVVLDVLKQARAVHLPVVLTVLKENPAKRFYERVGFRVVGEREHVYEMSVGG